ncbi:16S rRNA (uracil(1498)-N(3))-methyltransferase [bacterium]|nr:16S rRNA (uracil(1498)-N(3))-methyltransferase [bacterium]NBW57644.1 16S rRNA (uracil(1498)-N(3))-methyltransferase [bacterium]NBX72533.1 16S rRNA (uracil(1498)-N(3))-methyltransferase [bacterium]
MAQSSPIFFLEKLSNQADLLILPESITHHLRVRRELDIGFKLTLSDGTLYTNAHIENITKKAVYVRCELIQYVSPKTTSIHLYQAVLKPDAMAWVCQKATEIGVSSIHPLLTERSQHHHWTAKTHEHLRKIIESAATQSHQLQLPVLAPVSTLDQKVWADKHTWFVAEFGGSRWPRSAPKQPLGILIGPEGGWSKKDVESFPAHVHKIELTSSILRAETAALVCLSLAFCT